MSIRFPRPHKGLVAVNIGLLLMLAAVTFAPTSIAQRSGSSGRARGEYTMLSGKTQGASSHAIYILDSSNQDMVAVRWNESTKSLDAVGYRDLKDDSQQSPGR